MGVWDRIARSNFLIRLRSWEYWPFGIVQFPAIVYWLWLSLRARSLFFFSASNPGIPMGGLFGESKYDILEKISPQYVPVSVRIALPTPAVVLRKMCAAGLKFPVIFKPDIGERGFMVERINDEQEIGPYLQRLKCPLIVQELITSPLEFGVFYRRFPSEPKGRVVSLVAKEMLSVTGDGKATLQELILRKDRAKLQWQKLKAKFLMELGDVVPKGKTIELVSIGNHAQGTRFINANRLITDELSDTFDRISNGIPGFYFGRYDLRCESLEDLYRGDVRIMELNGCGAEPAHIYDTQYSLWRAFYDLVKHWDNIFRIARANNEKGIDYISRREAFAHYRRFKSVIR